MENLGFLKEFFEGVWSFFQLDFPGLSISIGSLFIAITLINVVLSAIKHIFGLDVENKEG